MAYKTDIKEDPTKQRTADDAYLESEEFQDMVDIEFEKEYDSKTVYKIFYLMFLSSVSVNLDHGSLPACSEEVKQKM